MAQAKAEGISGRDHYKDLYCAELELEAEWLRYGAVEKVNSIEQLLNQHGIKPASLLELGCGTGAVISECQRRRIGHDFTAIDYSQEALEYLAAHSSGINCVAADITNAGFTLDQQFDLVVLSHVLEHLEQPLVFLESLLTKVRFRYLVAEVPLEDLPALRLKSLLSDRARNPAGHVQFFTGATFRRFIRSAGLDMKGHRRYVPVLSPEVVRFVSKKDGLSNFRRGLAMWTRYRLPLLLRPLWGRLYYSHYAVLCVRRTDGSA